MSRPWAFALPLLVLVLAGCLGSGLSQAPNAPEPPALGDDGATVRGYVVSDEELPLAKALVRLQRTNLTDVTNLQGAFLLSDAPPGRHTLVAELDGFEPARRELDLPAGSETQVRLVLIPTPIPEPYAETKILRGFWTCAAPTIYFYTVCDETGTVTHEYEWRYDVHVEDHWESLVLEATWDPSALTAETTPGTLMGHRGAFHEDHNDPLAEGILNFPGTFGGNPVRARFTPGQETTDQDGNPLDTVPRSAYHHFGNVFPWGILVNETEPVHDAFPFQTGPSAGIGLVVMQSFEVYATVHYWAAGPEDYTALPQ